MILRIFSPQSKNRLNACLAVSWPCLHFFPLVASLLVLLPSSGLQLRTVKRYREDNRPVMYFFSSGRNLNFWSTNLIFLAQSSALQSVAVQAVDWQRRLLFQQFFSFFHFSFLISVSCQKTYLAKVEVSAQKS